MIVVVNSCPGREEQSYETFTWLTRQNPGFPIWIYRCRIPDSVGEFWRMLEAFKDHDVLALEDDVITARNFFAYAAELWTSPHVTSFFHPHAGSIVGRPTSPQGFHFTQAIKFPRAILARLLATPQRKHEGMGQDDDIGFRLHDLREPVIYHPTLVQHTGRRSLFWGPERSLEYREAKDFPGLDFDCLTIGATK